jgi:division protein CdvB (Snf7/Vps24/ESCRT-III family)
MRQVTGSMGQVVKGMDKAMESMNLERASRSHLQKKVEIAHPVRLPTPALDISCHGQV